MWRGLQEQPALHSSSPVCRSQMKGATACCTVSNYAGSETSQCATLTVGKNCCEERVQYICTLAVLTVQHSEHSFSLHCLYCQDTTPVNISVYLLCANNRKQSQQLVACGSLAADPPPSITTHPHGIKDAVPGNQVAFTIQATGTEPLNYQWEREIGGNDVKRNPGANSSTFTIPSVQKSNEGSYHCTVRNCAGSETTECATLTVGKNHCEKAIQFVCTLAVLKVNTLDAHFHYIVCSARTQLPEAYQYIYCVQTVTTVCCFDSMQPTPPELPLTQRQ